MAISHSMWRLVIQSDFFTQMLVLLLFVGALVCLAYALYAYLILRAKKHQLMHATHYFVKNEHPNLLQYSQEHTQSLPGLFIRSTLKNSTEDRLSLEETHTILTHEYFTREIHITKLLGAAAAVSPLLGLLGTVWGIIHAFLSMSQSQGADLAAVAPGIAEALITTLAGLWVAIPALVFYHLLSLQISRCDALASIVSSRILTLHTENKA